MRMDNDESIKAELEAARTTTNKVVNENPDSLEIGTPSKGGAIKIYGDFSKKEEFKAKIDAAFAAKEYANSRIGNA